MPCMCGDPYCPSCGPAQGFDPAWEGVMEKLYEKFPWLDTLDPDKVNEMATYLVNVGIEEGRHQEKESHLAEQLEEEEELFCLEYPDRKYQQKKKE